MLPRFYAPDAANGAEFRLPPDEARHLTTVLRLRPGDEVAVFDGTGAEYRARIVHADRSAAVLQTLAAIEPAARRRVSITLAQAVLKGGSMDDAVRDAAMLGVSAVVPLITDHVAVKTALPKRPETLARWSRVALAGVKQSRSATIPRIESPRAIADWLGEGSADVKLLFAEPAISHSVRTLRQVVGGHVPATAIALIGPEGGWSAAEVRNAIGAGYTPVSLGPLTLRAETMALAAVAALTALWED